jgi:hypothetical protein
VVNLGYDLGFALPLLRAQAESRFTEVFTFFTQEEGPVNPETFEPTVVETIVGADIPGRFKSVNTQGRDVESGGQYPVVGRREVHVAVGAVALTVPAPALVPGAELAPGVGAMPDVFVRCIASTVDAGLVGRVFRVSERPSSGQVTAWRYPVEEVS